MVTTYNKNYLLLILMVIAGVLSSCGEADSRLINKVKTFEPQWSVLNEKLVVIDRNLEVCEVRFEQDFKHIEGILGDIPDTLRGKDFRGMLKDYENIILKRDSMRKQFVTKKATYLESVNTFNEFEKQVMGGDISLAEGTDKLAEYKAIFGDIDGIADQQLTQLEVIVGTHNYVIRQLSELANLHTNYDIHLK